MQDSAIKQGQVVPAPRLGRIILYSEYGREYPGMIIHVDRTAQGLVETINLVYWNEHGDQLLRRAVAMSPTSKKLDKHWYWDFGPQLSLDQIRALGEQMKQQIEATKHGQEPKP